MIRSRALDGGKFSGVYVSAGVFVVSIAAVVLGYFKDFDGDLPWHLRCGYVFLETRHILTEDVFSFTARGEPFCNHEWLAGVLFAWIHSWSGFDGLVVVKAIGSGLVLLALAATCKAKGGSGFSMPVSLLVGLLLLRYRLQVKPEVLSYLLLTVFDLVATVYLRKGAWVRLLPLVALSLIWANFHLLVVGGIALLFLHAAGEWVGRRLKVQAAVAGMGNPWMLTLFAVCAALATLVNPYGLDVFRPVFQVYWSPIVVGTAVREWFPPDLAHFRLFFIVAPAMTLVLLLTIKRSSLQDVAIWAGTLALALRSQRHIGLFALLTAPILAKHLSLLAEGAKPALRRLAPRLSGLLAPWTVLICFVLTVAYLVLKLLSPHQSFLHQDESRQFRPGPGLLECAFPVAVMDAVDRRGFEGPLYNTYSLGGYVLWRAWPRLLDFVDGRNFVFEHLFARIHRMPAQQVLAEYGIRMGIVAYSDRVFLEAFRSHDGFCLVGFDDAALLFVAADQMGREPRGMSPYRFLRPEDLSLRWWEALDAEGRRAAADEAARSARVTPGCSRAWAIVGGIARRVDDPRGAVAALETAARIDPAQMAFRNNLGSARLAMGQAEEALLDFREAEALDPTAVGPITNAGLALAEAGRTEEALDELRRALALNPREASVHLFIGLLDENKEEAIEHLREALALSLDEHLRARAIDRLHALEH